jgi:hypothetical protein
MKKFLILLVACILGSLITVDAQVYVRGYYRKDGTYVQGHYRSEPNHTNHDNYSTSGNINPYTGSVGSTARDYSSEAYNYGGGRTIHTGPQGGQYYINDNGNKTYVPKRSTSSSSSTSLYGWGL